jgi:hypothetical protein
LDKRFNSLGNQPALHPDQPLPFSLRDLLIGPIEAQTFIENRLNPSRQPLSCLSIISPTPLTKEGRNLFDREYVIDHSQSPGLIVLRIWAGWNMSKQWPQFGQHRLYLARAMLASRRRSARSALTMPLSGTRWSSA